MGLYSKKGGYSGYDKKNKEREALDYYSTPTEEVTNILNTIKLDLKDQLILEPCCDGGHMVQGILNYYKDSNIVATDIQDRGNITDIDFMTGKEFDFLSDKYPCVENIDYIIMNPPYSVIEPFVRKSLAIAKKGVLMLGRLQFLEGKARYETILKDYPPTDIYIYVDRITCYKNGDVKNKVAAIQAAWFYWNFEKFSNKKETLCHWIKRV